MALSLLKKTITTKVLERGSLSWRTQKVLTARIACVKTKVPASDQRYRLLFLKRQWRSEGSWSLWSSEKYIEKPSRERESPSVVFWISARSLLHQELPSCALERDAQEIHTEVFRKRTTLCSCPAGEEAEGEGRTTPSPSFKSRLQ